MKHHARRDNVRASAGDSVRQIAAVVAVGALLGVGLFASGQYITARPHVGRVASAPAAPTKTAAAGTAVDDDDIYTGSILYMPEEGRTCRQYLFDNQTGRFSDNGYVDCVNAAYHSPNDPKLWSAARARVISNGFRRE